MLEDELIQFENELLKDNDFRGFKVKKLKDVKYKIGRMIREARIVQSMSQVDLANKLDTRQPAIARYEKGEEDIKISTLVNIAKALNTRLISPRFESMKEIEEEYDNLGLC